MTPLILLLSLGFSLGLLHALEGDHIAAVLALSNKTGNSKHVPLLGLVWGLGHTTVLLFVGFLVLALKFSIPSGLAHSFEALVGILLLVLGIDLLLKVWKRDPHIHIHSHGGKEHVHFHSHAESKGHGHFHKTFGFGLIHGLAGSGALLLLVLAEATTVLEGLAFIAIFGVGSIFGMSLVSIGLGYLIRLIEGNVKVYRVFQSGAGFVSIFFGSTLIYATALSYIA